MSTQQTLTASQMVGAGFAGGLIGLIKQNLSPKPKVCVLLSGVWRDIECPTGRFAGAMNTSMLRPLLALRILLLVPLPGKVCSCKTPQSHENHTPTSQAT